MSNYNSPKETTEYLYKQMSKSLKYFIASRINNPEIVEDLLHEIFIKIHDKIGTLNKHEKMESWVFQITRNTIIDHYRRKTNNIETVDEDNLANDDLGDNTHAKASDGITEFVNQLPDIYKEAILLTEYEGLTQKELAERLGISLTGAKSRVQRGRKMLKNLLLECCHFDYDIYGTVIDYHKVCCCCASQNK